MFVDGPEFFLVLAQQDTEGNILTKFKKKKTSGIGGDAITKNVYRRTVGRQTDAGEFPDRKKSSSGLRLEELLIYIKKSALKRAFKFR